MKAICVYCGSASGKDLIFTDAARQLARALSDHDLDLVYGGGNVGLMKVIADEMIALNRRVTGVIPRALLERELAHENLSELHIVNDMHERKALMAALSDGFIALPGGLGTLEELFEMLTWLQLGFHQKPVGLFNVAAYYDHLLAFLQHASDQQFLKPAHLSLLQSGTEPNELVGRLKQLSQKSLPV